MGLESRGIDRQQVLASLPRCRERPLSAEGEVEREREQPLLRVGEAGIAPRRLQIGIEAAARIGHAHTHLVGGGHVAAAQVGDVCLHVAGRPGELRRLLADRPRDLQGRLIESGEQLAARPQHHVVQGELLLRRIHQQDPDADAVGQLGRAVQHVLGPVRQADVAGLFQRPRLRGDDPAVSMDAVLAVQGTVRGELRQVGVQTRRLAEALRERPRQRPGVDALRRIQHPPAAVERHRERKDHHLLGHARPLPCAKV